MSARFDSGLVLLIKAAALRAGLEPALVAALVAQESSGNPWAFRAEPQFHTMWDVAAWQPFRTLSAAEVASEAPPQAFASLAPCSRTSEWWGQQVSWGPMQLIGATARWQGFRGPFLSELCSPDVGLLWGCRYFAHLRSLHPIEKAVSAYNAGAPTDANTESYVKPVLALYEKFAAGGLGA
jgi:hypothetical protein